MFGQNNHAENFHMQKYLLAQKFTVQRDMNRKQIPKVQCSDSSQREF